MRYIDKTYNGKRLFASIQVVDLFTKTRDAGTEYPIFYITFCTVKDTKRKAIMLTIPWVKITVGC